MADWSQLPKDLLQLISQKLNNHFYILRFRSVCSTWRLSIPKPHNHFPLKLPHFSRRNKLYNHIIFLIKPPATPNQQSLYRPWLVRISPTSSGKFNLWHPLGVHYITQLPSDLRVLDFNQLSVFNIEEIYIRGESYPNSSTTRFYHYDRSLATFQREQILDIVTSHRNSKEMVMFRCGGNGLTKIPNVSSFYQGMCIFKGRPCVTYQNGRTVMIGSDLSVDLVAEPVFGDELNGDIYIMVENESELLLVHNYEEDYDSDDDYDEYEPIDVFRLDQKEKKWLKLENLGDTVLFLGQGYSFAISASDLGLDNGNFVIYCNYNHNEIRVFPLDQHRTFLLSDYPDYFKLFWPPPEWIASRCM
ncbi:F-box protein SKIP23-like [Vicia villosa]|uniref:F-box protein SKIP23-like n=1 Tax=Vicia villosa TaxID=3911 RepID=UPI00273A837F|nr:F-box protein SKIP23-like [Vicia villosa]XP_058752455.1 F-box protein SKIP23-like [Vicia villosa]